MMYRPELTSRCFRLAGLVVLAVLLAVGVFAGADKAHAGGSPPGEWGERLKETPTGWVPQAQRQHEPPPTELRMALCPVFDSSVPGLLFPVLPPSDSDFKKWLKRLDEASGQLAERADSSAPATPVAFALPVAHDVPGALAALGAPVAANVPRLAALSGSVLWYGPALFAIPPPASACFLA